MIGNRRLEGRDEDLHIYTERTSIDVRHAVEMINVNLQDGPFVYNCASNALGYADVALFTEVALAAAILLHCTNQVSLALRLMENGKQHVGGSKAYLSEPMPRYFLSRTPSWKKY